ncbi:MAG: hypothetical protein AAGA70_01405 [Pseudomonadota bacterium]
MADLPPLALSVRQPWAWAILCAGKDIENRSLGSIRAGGMVPGRIALHAAADMTRDEYHWALWRMGQDGITVPSADTLVRRAIIGSVEVVEIVTHSSSRWFGGAAGLRLRDPQPCDPIPAPGALGYFEWSPGGSAAPALPWMSRDGGPGLFADLPAAFKDPPKRPFRSNKP